MKILITGATGFVGKQLVKRLEKTSHKLIILTRSAHKAREIFGQNHQYLEWSYQSGEFPQVELEGVEAVLNLMGEGIAEKRWSVKQKEKIYNSRVEGSKALVRAIGKLSNPLKVFVSTSAIGFYGDGGETLLDESSPSTSNSQDFLAHVCRDWELAVKDVKASRLVILRVGVVLGTEGGALSKLLPIFKLGMGGPVGRGRQFMSWIHQEDLVSLYLESLDNLNLKGTLNATAPGPVTNAEFSKALGSALHRPAFFPVPTQVLRLAMGEGSQLVIDSTRVLPKRTVELGFKFKYVEILEALKQLIS